MRRLILFIFTLLLFSVTVASAQTYYYERVAIVENGSQQTASGDGHFITFTRDGRCFDSDSRGYNENSGIRKFTHQQNGVSCYEGQSYWGNAKYLFNSDKSRLNIRLASGTTYVYTRKAAPAGVTASKRAPRSSSSSSYTSTPVVVPSTSPSYGSSSSSPSSSTSPSSQNRYGYYTCPSCQGSGRCPICKGKHITHNSYTGGSHICYSCNNNGDCSACGGSGKKYGIVR